MTDPTTQAGQELPPSIEQALRELVAWKDADNERRYAKVTMNAHDREEAQYEHGMRGWNAWKTARAALAQRDVAAVAVAMTDEWLQAAFKRAVKVAQIYEGNGDDVLRGFANRVLQEFGDKEAIHAALSVEYSYRREAEKTEFATNPAPQGEKT